jgi:uncharacterized protein YcfL
MKTMHRTAALLLASAPLLLACTSTGKGGAQMTVQGAEALPGMTELDSGLAISQDLEILNLVQVRKNDFLVAQFELHNKRGSQVNLEWSVDWTDEQGLRIDSNENWRPLSIGGRGFELLQITAPTPSAKAWRLKVQQPNPIR